MNICFFSVVTFWHGIKGGMDLHGKHLLEGLAANGHKITVITTKHPTDQAYEERNGIKIHYLENTSYGSPRKGWKKASRDKFIDILKQEKIDIVISQSKGGYGVVGEAKKRNIPFITIMHGYETMILYSMIKQTINFKKGFLSLLKTFFSSLYYSVFQEYPLLLQSSLIISPSDNVSSVLGKRPFVKQSNIKTVIYGIDLSNFSPSEGSRQRTREIFNIDNHHKVILFLSLLSKQKGADVVLKAVDVLLSQDQNIKLILGGDGDYLEEAKQLASDLGIADKVIFPGYIVNEKTADFYNACDIFVFPTLRYESFGIVLAEAMACEKPVIASNIGSIPDVIDDGKNGILIKPGDHMELAKQVKRLLNDNELSNKLSINARDKAGREFSIDRMIDKTMGLIESLIL